MKAGGCRWISQMDVGSVMQMFVGKANFSSFLCPRWWNMHGTATGNMAGATTSSNPSPRKDIPPISSVSKDACWSLIYM